MRLPTGEWFCGDRTEHSFNSTLLERLQEQTILESPMLTGQHLMGRGGDGPVWGSWSPLHRYKGLPKEGSGNWEMDRISIVIFCLTALKGECLLTMEWAVVGSNELLITGGV